MQQEILINAAQVRDKVVFECADLTFSSVAPVDFAGDKLVVNGSLAHECFERVPTLVVKTFELWSHSCSNKPV